jgi:predicted ester cyclase
VGLKAYRGYDKAIRKTFPDFKMSIEKFFVSRDKIVAYWSLVATQSGPMITPQGELPPTNKELKISGVSISTIVDGKIKRDEAYFDMLRFLTQLGFTLTPPPSPLPE